jgi:hypothetical protein
MRLFELISRHLFAHKEPTDSARDKSFPVDTDKEGGRWSELQGRQISFVFNLEDTFPDTFPMASKESLARE